MSAAKSNPAYRPVSRIPAKTKPSLEAALAEMDQGGDRALALDHLLGVWREANAPKIADVIDLLSEELAAKEPPIRAVGSMSATKIWDKLASEGRAETVGRLLEVLPDGQNRCLRMRTLIEDGDRDPRYGTYATIWFQKPPVHGSNRAGFFATVVEILKKTKDARILDLIRGMTEAARRSSTIANIGLHNWKPLIALVKDLQGIKIESLSADDEKILTAIQERIRPKEDKDKKQTRGGGATTDADADPSAFFAKVYADPSDDEPRAVLGDLLQQKGDPRGEFIALQLTRAQSGGRKSARENELEDQWGRDWLGPLEKCILKGGVVFERGFLAECRFHGGSAGAEVAKCDEWATVTRIDCTSASGFSGGSKDLLLSPKLRSLKHVVGISTQDETALSTSNQSFPWETLGIRVWPFDATRLEAPAILKTFPKLQRLILTPSWGYSTTGLTVPAVVSVLKNLSKRLSVLELTVEATFLVGLALSKEIGMLDQLVLHLQNQVTFEIHPKENRVEIVLDDLRDNAVLAAAPILSAFGTAELVKRAHVTATGRVKLEKGVLSRGRYERATIKPLEDAARVGNVELTIL